MAKNVLWTAKARDELKVIAIYTGRTDARHSTAEKNIREIRKAVDNHAAKELLAESILQLQLNGDSLATNAGSFLIDRIVME